MKMFVLRCRYVKTVVDSSLISQRYNPEFAFVASSSAGTESKAYSNANVSVLIDQLRHINQVKRLLTSSFFYNTCLSI